MQITKLPERIYSYFIEQNHVQTGYTLSFFRIVYVLQCFVILYHTHIYKALLFDSVAGFSKNVFPFNTLLACWFLSLLFLLIGYFTRYAAIANYICIILITDLYARAGVNSYYDDMLKVGGIILFLFPVNSRFSFDSIINPSIRYSCNKLHYVSAWILYFGLMYFMSGISKLLSPVWQKGLGVWTPLSMPYWRWGGWMDGLQDQFYVMVAINYIVIIWELVFIFLIFSRKWRGSMVFTGVVFHLVIASFFYFPQTALLAASSYALFIPEKFWIRLYNLIGSHRKYSVYVTGNDTSSAYYQFIKSLDYRNKFIPAYDAYEADIILNSKHAVGNALTKYLLYTPLKWYFNSNKPFDNQTLTKKGSLYLHGFGNRTIVNVTLFFIALQLIYMLAYCYTKLNYKDTSNQYINNYSNKERGLKPEPFSIMRTFLGINSKSVFIDKAMLAKRKCYAITYYDSTSVKWLPIMNTSGFTATDLSKDGCWWKVHQFAITDSKDGLNENHLIRSIMFLSIKQRIDLKKTRFRILYRNYEAPREYEKGYYLKMYELPWLTAGIVEPTGNIPRFIPAKSFKP
jgi:hypothetical protein